MGAGLPRGLRRAKALLAAALAFIGLAGFVLLDLGEHGGGWPMVRALAAGLLAGALGNLAAYRVALALYRRGRSSWMRLAYTLTGFAGLGLLIGLLLLPAVGHGVTGWPVAEHAARAGAACVRAIVGYLAMNFLLEAHRAWHGSGGAPRRG